MLAARIIGGIGRFLIWAGVIVLLFVAYQLWGTGIAEARAQDSLEDEFNALVAGLDLPAPTAPDPDARDPDPGDPDPDPGDPDPGDPTTTTASTIAPLAPLVDEGDAIARLVIPRIGVDKIVIEGVGRSDLQKGPGHYPDTPLPGQPGNAAIAGHRTTYGQPFFEVDQLVQGDDIFVTTVQGVFRYEVIGTRIVSPTSVQVVEDKGDDRLTLTSCHPKFSAAQRIIVSARLTDDPAPTLPAPPPTSTPVEDDDDATPTTTRPDRDVVTTEGAAAPLQSLDGDAERRAGPALLWGSVTMAVWLAFYVLSRRWRRIPAYVIGAPVFAMSLFVFFGALSHLLPANY